MLQKTRLLTPGPTPIPSRVRLRMAEEMIHHRKDAFKDVMQSLQPKLQKLFGTESVVLPLSCSGTGVMTAAVHALFNPAKKEKVLVVNGGKFGERFIKIAETYGLLVQSLDVTWGNAVDAKLIENALDADPSITGVLMQLSETSTGVLHPVHKVAEITKNRSVLLVVDGISAVGISPCNMDKLGIDCLLTGSQKGLMVPPGLSLIALSKRAWEKAESNPQSCFYFNLPKERDKVIQNQTLFTSPVSLILALDEGLNIIFENGSDSLEKLYRKQWALTMMARHAMNALGLELLAKEHFTWGLTSVLMPEGVDASKVISLAAKHYGVILSGGQDHLKGRIVRIGHMGWVDWSDLMAGLYAFASSFKEVGGYFASRDYLELSLHAYEAALNVVPGTTIGQIRS